MISKPKNLYKRQVRWKPPKQECAICRKALPKSELLYQRGMLVCIDCYDEPELKGTVRSRRL